MQQQEGLLWVRRFSVRKGNEPMNRVVLSQLVLEGWHGSDGSKNPHIYA